MKKLVLITTFLISLMIFTPTYGHMVGQPPFFKVNGKYSILYPVPLTSLPDFNLPQDLALDKYLVSKKIEFELDTSALPAPPEIIEKTEFFWDFGDKTTGEGLKNSHIYKKPGSYILTIKAQYITDPQPQLFQSTLIHVVPNPDYKIPIAIIKINGKESKDPLTDVLKSDFSNEVTLDATTSQSSTKIIKYIWDLGDQKTSNQPTLKYKYDPSLKIVFPVLRITTEDGFMADSFVEIENSPNLLTNPSDTVKNISTTNNPILQIGGYFLILFGIIGVSIGFYVKRKKTKKI